MARITDYATLRSSIKGWAYDADEITDAEIDEIIQQAEAEMMDLLRVREMVVRNFDITIDSAGEGTLPANFLGMKTLKQLGARRTTLRQRSEEELDDEYPYAATAADPKFYAVVGEEIIIRPISTTGLKATYYSRWDGISATNTTNAILTAHPNLYLFACRKQLAVFEDDTSDLNKYDRLMKEAIDAKNEISVDETFGRAARRSKGPRP